MVVISLARLKDAVARAYIRGLVGKDGLIMVDKAPKGEVTDEKVAEVTGVSLNTVRRALYILYENGLASYETNFVCPICGATLEYEDNTKLVKALEKKIDEIQKCMRATQGAQ